MPSSKAGVLPSENAAKVKAIAALTPLRSLVGRMAADFLTLRDVPRQEGKEIGEDVAP